MSDTTSSASPSLNDKQVLSSSQIARATGTIMMAFVLSGILGLFRQIILASIFGADRELDAFYAALRLPETLFTLVAGGALGSAFIPVFSRFLAKDDPRGAWRLVGAILMFLIAIASGLAVIGFIFAGFLTRTLLIPSADGQTQDLTIELMRIMLATVVLFGISGLVMGILNTYQRFLTPALAPSMYNIGIIIGAIFLSPTYGIHGLAWGAVIGAGLHMVIQIPNVMRLPHIKQLRLNLQVKTEGVTEVLTLMGPRLLGLMVVQVNFWVNVSLASDMDTGSLTALITAFTLMFTVLGVLGQSLGTAAFPTLSALYANGDMEGFARILNRALTGVLFLSIPAGLGMVILADPIITVLLERGEWTAADTSATAWALLFYGIGLSGHAALEILARTYYALHDTWTPVVIGGGAMVLNIVLSLILVVMFRNLGADTFTRGPFGGLALANSLATAIESTVLWLMLHKRLPSLDTHNVQSTLFRTWIAGGIMVVGVWGILQLLASQSVFLQLFAGITTGIIVFGVTALVLKIESAQSVPRQILARFGR